MGRRVGAFPGLSWIRSSCRGFAALPGMPTACSPKMPYYTYNVLNSSCNPNAPACHSLLRCPQRGQHTLPPAAKMPCLLQHQQRHQLCRMPQQHVYHSDQRRCWQRHTGTHSRPPAAAQRGQQLTVESEEDSAKAVAADLRSSGPQRSIHTAAERQQHSLHLQQAITARSSVVGASAPSPAFDGLSSAAVAAANAETSEVNRRDIFRAIFISGVACVLAGVLDHEWVEAHKVNTRTHTSLAALPAGPPFAALQLCTVERQPVLLPYKIASASPATREQLRLTRSGCCAGAPRLRTCPSAWPAGPLYDAAVHPWLHRHIC